MYYIYVIYSERSNKYYVGYTQDYIKRLYEHNTSQRNVYTSKYRPWDLKAVFSCGSDVSVAVQIERFIKRQKSRKFIESLINGEGFTGILAQLVRVPQERD
ncbi:MAG: GIY-YIG nuclease family protein [Hydrotalea sp.]|jgi:putative endonuclease|nr:GIY-YIG nuclease family protein [Hydrotalea sp.]